MTGDMPADSIAEAAALFRSARELEPAFEPERPEHDDIDDALPEAAEIDAEPDDDIVAADDAQPDAVDMPVSWSKDDAVLWDALPPETQARLAEREGQREAAINAKFQDAANARKAHQAELAEAHATRDAFAEAIGTVISMVQPTPPDPYDYGLGSGDYDREAYDLALVDYEQTAGLVEHLAQQQQAIAAQQAEEYEWERQAAYQAVEEVARPRFLADVPDVATPKGAEILGAIVDYAIAHGIPPSAFEPENQGNITSAELHMAWKAMQYDRLQAAKGRVQPRAQPQPAPQTRPASPALRPGVATPRGSQRKIAFGNDMARLAKSGSVEDGAAIFRHMRKGY